VPGYRLGRQKQLSADLSVKSLPSWRAPGARTTAAARMTGALTAASVRGRPPMRAGEAVRIPNSVLDSGIVRN
jgi:hypothetical protein